MPALQPVHFIMLCCWSSSAEFVTSSWSLLLVTLHFEGKQDVMENTEHSASYETLVYETMCVLLLKLFALFCITCRFMHCWWGRHCIMLQLHGMVQGDERRRMCAADDKMHCILLLFTAQRVAPRRNLTLPACKLQNPTGISVASHRFVSMAFDWPTWMYFYGLWFPFESVPVDPCERISASTIVSATATRTAENLSINGNTSACFFVLFPKGTASLFLFYSTDMHTAFAAQSPLNPVRFNHYHFHPCIKIEMRFSYFPYISSVLCQGS